MLTTAFLFFLAADVWTVDDSGGADFSDLQPAIDAAQDGDLLLVRSGGYGPFEIAGKAVSIASDGPGALIAVVTGAGVVRDLGPTQHVVLRGLTIRQPSSALATTPLLTLGSNQGVVAVEDCTLDGAGSNDVLTTSALRVDACDAVFVVGSLLEAATSSQFLVGSGPFGGAHGLDVSASNVAVFDCDVRGGDGGAGWFTDFDTGIPPQPGAHGALVASGLLHAAGSSFTGGAGGDGADFPGGACWYAQNGGTGVAVQDGTVELLDGVTVAGPGGTASTAPCTDGAAGSATSVSGTGSIASLAGVAASASASDPAREGQTASLAVDAPDGSVVVAFAAPQPAFYPVRIASGVAGLQFAPFLLGSAVVPVGGPATIGASVPELGLGVDGVVLRAQAYVLPPFDPSVLTPPVSLVLLDASF